MSPAVAVMPPNEIIFTSSRFEQMRQTQKITPMTKKGREKVRFMVLVFYVVFKHTEGVLLLLAGFTKWFSGAKVKSFSDNNKQAFLPSSATVN